MTFAFSDLITPVTADDVLETLFSIGDSIGLPLRNWQPFGVGREILFTVAQLFADKDQIREFVTKSGFLDFAVEQENSTGKRNKWLDVLGHSVYGVDRVEATFATTTLTLTNSTGSPISVPATQHFGKDDGSVTYSVDNAVSVPANGTATVDITADESGSIGSAAPGGITTFVNPIPGLTATNAGPAIGSDLQSATDYGQLCKDRLGALSPDGPRGAYAFVAKNATDANGVNLGVTRVKVVSVDLDNTVDVYLADADGPVTTGVRDAVDALIQGLTPGTGAVPDGISETTHAAVGHNVLVVCDVYATTAIPPADILNALVAYFGSDISMPIGGVDVGAGGFVFRDGISGAIHAAFPTVRKVVVNTPAADVPLGATEVAVLTSVAGDITVLPVL